MKVNDKERMIAAGVTMVAVLLILLVLFTCGLSFDRQLLATQSTPEIAPDEELFLEPELLRDLGEENAVTQDAPAEAYKGQPTPAPVENNKLVVKGENPKPAPPEEKLVSTKKESPVQTTEPSISKEEKQQVTSAVAKGFSRNGAEEGAKGVGIGIGMGISGNASGRTFRGCPKPDVTLRNKTTVKVSVVIDAEGNVTSAKASGGASAAIRRACEQAALGAKWSAKKGASETRGSITFTITPK